MDRAGDRRRFFGNQNLLHFAGRFYFQFDPGLPLPLQKLFPRNGENQGQEQQGAENKSHVEEIATEVEAEARKSGLPASNG